MLVRFQRPGAEYVLTEREWRRYRRAVNHDATPLIVLFPFGPVNFVFDIADTHPLNPQDSIPINQILEDLAKPYKTTGILNPDYLKKLIYNLSYHSIAFNPNMQAGSVLGAKISLLKEPYDSLYIGIRRDMPPINWKADYIIGTNSKGDMRQTFAAIVHELGHFFCYHLPAPKDWKPWIVRNLSHEAKEFEAETVSWIICDKVNLDNNPEKYLSYFVDGKIPDGVSIDAIFTACNKVWDLCSRSYFPYNEGFLYKHNKEFHELVKRSINQYKAS